MKAIIINVLVLIMMVFGGNVKAQNWLWAVNIDADNRIEPEAIKQDYDGNIIVLTELTGSATISGHTFTSVSPDKKDMLVIKLDKYGHYLWGFQIGGTEFDDPKNMYLDSINNIYITGSFGDQITIGDYTLTATDLKDAFLCKIDKNGNVVWAKNIGSNTGIQKGRTLTSDGTYLYVVGFYYNSIYISKSADTTLEGSDTKNYFLAKYDLDGNFISARRIYSSRNAILFPSILTIGDYLYLGGYYSGMLIIGQDTVVGGARDMIVMKLTKDGDPVWIKTWGNYNDYDEIWDMTTDGNNLYFAGYSLQPFICDSFNVGNNGMSDAIVGKIDLDGNIQWIKNIGSSHKDLGLGVHYLDNKLVITGTFSDTISWGNSTIIAHFNTQPYVGYITSDGELINAFSVIAGSDGDNKGYKIFEDEGGHVFVIGKYNSNFLQFNDSITISNSSSDYDGFISKYGCFEGITLNVHDAGCSSDSDGEITAIPNEGYGPFYYKWSNGANTQTISGLSEGDYTVTVTDETGCSAVATAHITYHPPLSVTTQLDSAILCHGDSSAQITAIADNGFSPYSYEWSSGDTTSTITNKPAGTYTITVTDQCGNTAVDEIEVTEPDELDVELKGKLYNYFIYCIAHVTASVSGGTPDYSYYWYDTDGNELGTDDNVWVSGGDWYILIIIDANGCAAGWYFYVPDCSKDNEDNDNIPDVIDTLSYEHCGIEITDFINYQYNGNSGTISSPGNLYSHFHQQNDGDIDVLPARIRDVIAKEFIDGNIAPKYVIYPNPINKDLAYEIEFPIPVNFEDVTITTLTGAVVWSKNVNTLSKSIREKIDVSDFENGMYILIIRTDLGIYKAKFTVMHK